MIYQLITISENNIGATKMQNNYGATKMQNNYGAI